MRLLSKCFHVSSSIIYTLKFLLKTRWVGHTKHDKKTKQASKQKDRKKIKTNQKKIILINKISLRVTNLLYFFSTLFLSAPPFFEIFPTPPIEHQPPPPLQAKFFKWHFLLLIQFKSERKKPILDIVLYFGDLTCVNFFTFSLK